MNCQREKTINDFDIRTHKDFHNYVNVDQIRTLEPQETCAPQGTVLLKELVHFFETCPPIENIQQRIELSLTRK